MGSQGRHGMLKHFNALLAGLYRARVASARLSCLERQMGRNNTHPPQESGRVVKPGFPAPHRILVPAKPIVSQLTGEVKFKKHI